MICPSCNYNNVPGADQCANCQQDLAPLDRPVPLDRVQHSLMNDPVSVLCPRPAITLAPGCTVAEAIQTMLARNIGAVPVVDAAGQLLGIFSERDLLLRVAGRCADHERRTVAEFMTPRPETVRESDTLAFALHKMDSGSYRHLPVLRDDRLVGMISVRDILRHLTKLCEGSRPGIKRGNNS
jgi:CBS domain-containing protein